MDCATTAMASSPLRTTWPQTNVVGQYVLNSRKQNQKIIRAAGIIINKALAILLIIFLVIERSPHFPGFE
jgi:hypothetical protein